MYVRRVVVGVTFALLLGSLARGVRAEQDDARAAVAARLDAYLDACGAWGWSGVALVALDGEVLVRRGVGLADREAGRAHTADTLFEVASVTKVFTACAVLRLVEAGKVALDDPLADHLPGVPEDKRDVTIRHLLAHTSGMSRMSGGAGATVAEAVASNLGGARARKAGEAVEYWNGGYALLAALVESVTGGTYEAFMAERVLAPAGMASSGFTGYGALPRDVQAVGYDGAAAVRRFVVDLVLIRGAEAKLGGQAERSGQEPDSHPQTSTRCSAHGFTFPVRSGRLSPPSS